MKQEKNSVEGKKSTVVCGLTSYDVGTIKLINRTITELVTPTKKQFERMWDFVVTSKNKFAGYTGTMNGSMPDKFDGWLWCGLLCFETYNARKMRWYSHKHNRICGLRLDNDNKIYCY